VAVVVAAAPLYQCRGIWIFSRRGRAWARNRQARTHPREAERVGGQRKRGAEGGFTRGPPSYLLRVGRQINRWGPGWDRLLTTAEVVTIVGRPAANGRGHSRAKRTLLLRANAVAVVLVGMAKLRNWTDRARRENKEILVRGRLGFRLWRPRTRGGEGGGGDQMHQKQRSASQCPERKMPAEGLDGRTEMLSSLPLSLGLFFLSRRRRLAVTRGREGQGAEGCPNLYPHFA
jgi:hypothetical protein